MAHREAKQPQRLQSRDDTARMFEDDPRARHSLSRHLSKKYDDFQNCGGAAQIPKFDSKAKAIRTSIVSLLRKQPGSANAAREVPRISKLIFGILEDAKRLNIHNVEFSAEIEILNRVLISVLNDRISSKYNGQCRYGEALLNGYIDIFITATLPKMHREFENKPSFLINPATGCILELDVMLEDFRLAFEFQGEHHYVEPKVQAKDAFKLLQCAAFDRVLVPVNISQLSGEKFASLTVNSMIAHCGTYGMLTSRNPKPPLDAVIKDKALFAFCKATQRVFLAQSLYGNALAWLDAKCASYIAAMYARNPISSTTPAPRLNVAGPDIAVYDVYSALPTINRYRSILRASKK